MSPSSPSHGAPITDKSQLVEYVVQGCKPPEAWRIGTENEKFAYRLDDLRPLPYDGPVSIRAVLEGLTKFDWEPVFEDGNLIALAKDGCTVTLEPGGQIELSGDKLETLHQTCEEVQQHLSEVREVAGELGVGLLGLGFNPKWRREDMPWMPKGRYRIMRAYMAKKGKLGHDMMLRTCAVQVNLDFASESDMVKKFRVGLALQPVVTALFANSPFVGGRAGACLSHRSHVWADTDPDRCGILPFVFEDGFGFERYVDYALDVPMYFVSRDGRYIDASGQSFRDFLAGRLPALEGELPTLGDWSDHLTTLFPEVRMKQFLEMRGADGGPQRRLCALPALWVGLLYDDTALDVAWDLVKDWTAEDRAMLRREVPRRALKTPFRGRELRALALEVLTIARAGLARRRRIDDSGRDEAYFLDTLTDIAASGRTLAEELLEAYESRWKGSVDPLFEEYAY